MHSRFGFIKTTVIGGAVFLIPAVIVVVALGKLIGALKMLAKVLGPVFGIKSAAGGVVLELIAIALTILLCFVVGLIAERATAKKLRAKLDRTLLHSFPGYAFIKGFADNLRQTEELSGSFVPVLVRFDDYSQIAFETDRRPDGRVTIYLPGAPNPWSGSIVFVAQHRVTPLAISLTEALRTIRVLGKGTVQIFEKELATENVR